VINRIDLVMDAVVCCAKIAPICRWMCSIIEWVISGDKVLISINGVRL
jgi:hypothetical protein